MTKQFVPMAQTKREPTGRFYRALIGPKSGQVGEAVTVHNWGGVSLRFGDGEVLTYADSDVEDEDRPGYAEMQYQAHLDL